MAFRSLIGSTLLVRAFSSDVCESGTCADEATLLQGVSKARQQIESDPKVLNCWDSCGRTGGYCDVCGPQGACCREQDWDDDPAECGGLGGLLPGPQHSCRLAVELEEEVDDADDDDDDDDDDDEAEAAEDDSDQIDEEEDDENEACDPGDEECDEKDALWSRFGSRHRKCNYNENAIRVANRRACQRAAMANNHPYYSFRGKRRQTSNRYRRHKCFTSATCEYPLSTIRRNRWRILALPSGATTDGCVTDNSNMRTSEGDQTGQPIPRTVKGAFETAAVRCCQEQEDGLQCSSQVDGVCHESATFLEAQNICEAANMRLCTQSEMDSNVCCGTGCWYNHFAVWIGDATEDSLASVQLPAPLTDLQRSRDRASLPYLVNMVAELRGHDYDATFCSLSHDDCATTDAFPGETTHSELRFAQVADQLARVPEMEVTGQIRRQGDLGYFIFNDILWEDDWKTFPIGANLEDHRKGRPIADAVMGGDSMAWSSRMIREKAQEFFQGRDSFTQADLTKWNNKLQHKILLDMDLTDDEEAAFEQYKTTSMLLSLLPKTLLSLIAPAVPQVAAQVAAVKHMHEELLDKYQDALDRDTRGIIQPFSDGRDKRFVADLFLTALTSAGGLSVPSLMGIGFAILHGAEAYGSVVLPDFELMNNNVEQFVLECVRRFPAVVGFPWWDPETLQSRTVLNIAMAMRDPLAWEAPKEFRLRPLSEYHETVGTGTKIGVAWAEQGKGNHGLTPDSRGCPGQQLSVVIISEMLRAYMPSQHEWSVAGVDGAVQITEGPCGAGDYTIVRNGALPEPVPPSPAASPQNLEAVQGIVEGLIDQMPQDWLATLLPAGQDPEALQGMLGGLLAQMPAEIVGMLASMPVGDLQGMLGGLMAQLPA